MTTEDQTSPTWTTTTKLIIGLTLVAIFAGVFLYYRSLVSLMILASIITYLFQPVVNWLTEKTRMSWRLSTTLVFLLLIILLVGLLTGAGLAIAQQLAGLVRVVQEFANDLPELADNLTDFLAQYGAESDLINLNQIANQLLETLQPLLGQAGSIVGSIATGAAVSIGRIFFVVFVAYFILSESSRVGEFHRSGFLFLLGPGIHIKQLAENIYADRFESGYTWRCQENPHQTKQAGHEESGNQHSCRVNVQSST